MDVKSIQNTSYSKMDFNATYKKTQMDVNIIDKNGKNIDFSMTFEDLNYEFKQESLSYNKESTYNQTAIADAINKGDWKKLDDIFKDLQAKSTKSSLNYNKTDIKGNSHSVKIEGLSQEEAKQLVSKDGYFGVDKTAQRVFDFVIKGAKDDPELLKAGREGVVQGLKDAEDAWGGKLADISYKTQDKTLKMLDDYMAKLGISTFDTSA